MDYLEEFVDFCQYQRSLSKNTIRSYEWDLKQFFKHLKDRDLDITRVKIRDIDSFIIFLRKEGKSIRTVNRKMFSLKMFYRYLQRIEIIEKNPLDFVTNIREPKRLPKYLTAEQQQALILASGNGNHRPQRDNWMRKRDHLMVLFFLDTGLRVSEVCGIELKNLNLDEGILKVIGKGNKEREIVLSNRLMEEIDVYLRVANHIELNRTVGPGLPARGVTLKMVAKEMGISYHAALSSVFRDPRKRLKQIKEFVENNIKPLPIKYLFFNQQGHSMNTRHIFRIIQEIGTRAGIEGLHPHELRHSFATNLRGKGADLLLIKDALGHSSVSSTEIYAHLGAEESKRELRQLIN